MIAATSDWTLERAARTMVAGHFRHLMVVEDHKVIGILSMSDIVATWARGRDEPAAAVSDGDRRAARLGPAHDTSTACGAPPSSTASRPSARASGSGCRCSTASSRTAPTSTVDTLAHLWERREPCPALHAEGGGAD